MKPKLSSSNRDRSSRCSSSSRSAIAFWMLALSPKRDEASEAGRAGRTGRRPRSPSTEAEVAAGRRSARSDFPVDYQQLVVLGKAVPGDDDTASLLVQVNQHRRPRRGPLQQPRARLRRRRAETAEARARAAEQPPARPGLADRGGRLALPLGATIGPAGLARDALHAHLRAAASSRSPTSSRGSTRWSRRRTKRSTVDGRLLTVNGFSLAGGAESRLPDAGSDLLGHHLPDPAERGPRRRRLAGKPGGAEATPAATTTGGGAMKTAEGTGAEDARAEGAGLPRRPLLRPARPPPAAAGRPRRWWRSSPCPFLLGGGLRRAAPSLPPGGAAALGSSAGQDLQADRGRGHARACATTASACSDRTPTDPFEQQYTEPASGGSGSSAEARVLRRPRPRPSAKSRSRPKARRPRSKWKRAARPDGDGSSNGSGGQRRRRRTGPGSAG